MIIFPCFFHCFIWNPGKSGRWKVVIDSVGNWAIDPHLGTCWMFVLCWCQLDGHRCSPGWLAGGPAPRPKFHRNLILHCLSSPWKWQFHGYNKFSILAALIKIKCMLHCFVRNSQRKVVSIGDFHNNIYNKSKLIGIGRFGSSNQVRPKKKITEIPTLFEHPQIPT